MSRTFERSAQSTQTPQRIDNADLYEEIGNLVIERADAGDKRCVEIFSRAWKRTTTRLNENSNAGSLGGETSEPSRIADIRGGTNVYCTK